MHAKMARMPFWHSRPGGCTRTFLHSAILSLSLIANASLAADTTTLPGHYYLEGVRETGAELVLQPDGAYDWGMSYGAVDLRSMGKWNFQNGKLTLTSGAPEPMQFRVRRDDEVDITRKIGPNMLHAFVILGRRGPVTNLEMMFESKSGKRATALNTKDGGVGVPMPDTEQWTRLGLRQAGAKHWQWVEVPAEQAKRRIVGFTVANPMVVAPPAFDTLVMKLDQGDLIMDGKSSNGGRYVKRP